MSRGKIMAKYNQATDYCFGFPKYVSEQKSSHRNPAILKYALKYKIDHVTSKYAI